MTISQQVSVSGTVFACDGGCELAYGIQDPGSSFSAAKTNILLPPTALSQAGSASDDVQISDFYTRSASVDASASQTFIMLNPTNFNLNLFVSGDLSGSSSLMFGTVNASSQYSLMFNLTNPYLVHLKGGILGSGFSSIGSFVGNIDGSLDGQLDLAGPGFQFDQALSVPIYSSDGKAFDDVFTLGPGHYTLTAASGLAGEESYFLSSSSSTQLSLNADFTAIPEPARVSAVLGVLMTVGLFFAGRHARY